jgi:hypothetical protein
MSGGEDTGTLPPSNLGNAILEAVKDMRTATDT